MPAEIDLHLYGCPELNGVELVLGHNKARQRPMIGIRMNGDLRAVGAFVSEDAYRAVVNILDTLCQSINAAEERRDERADGDGARSHPSTNDGPRHEQADGSGA